MMTVILKLHRETAYNVLDIVHLLVLTVVCISAISIPFCSYDRRYQVFVLVKLLSALLVHALLVSCM